MHVTIPIDWLLNWYFWAGYIAATVLWVVAVVVALAKAFEGFNPFPG